ncbi:phasin family protein [Paraburkholderia fungorum]|uniref:phasin family protein n=1 Tax=Paraburkholderia fungorum TaxID=134537 RepID=UPI0038B83483
MTSRHSPVEWVLLHCSNPLFLGPRGAWFCFHSEPLALLPPYPYGAVMSTLIPQQLAAAQQASVETFFGLTNKAFEGFEKLVALNLQVSKATLAENQEALTKALSAGNPADFFALQAGLSQPAADKLAAYGRQVHEIVSGVQSEITATLTAQGEQFQREAQGFVESLKKNAPAGSESAVAAWNSVLSAANATYESANKAAKQFVSTVSAVQ